MRITTAIGVALLALLPLGPAAAQGTAYPDRPVRMVVPFAAGGLADITFRLVGEKLSGLLGKQVVIENIPGAGGIAAAQAVLRAKPDGHTLLVIANGTAITKSLFKSLPYDPVKDLAAVSFAAYFDLIVLTKADERYRTLPDLLAAARANPGKLNFGTINPGSTQHLSAELFKTTAGINVAVVPFKTTPEAFSALLAGEIDAVFESYATAKALIDGNRIRALASSGPKRSAYLPAVPTVQEAGVPGYDVTGWNALSAPAGTPPEVLAILNRHMNTVMAMPDVRKRLLELGTEAYAGSQDDLRNRLNADIAKWATVIRQAGVPQQ
jgi:tripartite-type tricarboxylate transporter receptor subunit TctC